MNNLLVVHVLIYMSLKIIITILFYKKVNIIKKVFSAMPIWTCGVDWKKVNSVTQAQAHTDRMESTCTLIRIK